MRRHRVGTECVQQEEVEIRVRIPLQLQPPVTDNHAAIGATSRKKSEEFPRDWLYRWINFEECHLVRGVCIGSHGSRTESQNAEMLRLVSFAPHLYDVTPRAARVVVRQRLAGTVGFRAF